MPEVWRRQDLAGDPARPTTRLGPGSTESGPTAHAPSLRGSLRESRHARRGDGGDPLGRAVRGQHEASTPPEHEEDRRNHRRPPGRDRDEGHPVANTREQEAGSVKTVSASGELNGVSVSAAPAKAVAVPPRATRTRAAAQATLRGRASSLRRPDEAIGAPGFLNGNHRVTLGDFWLYSMGCVFRGDLKMRSDWPRTRLAGVAVFLVAFDTKLRLRAWYPDRVDRERRNTRRGADLLDESPGLGPQQVL